MESVQHVLSPLTAPVLLAVVLGRRTVAGIRDDLHGVFGIDTTAAPIVGILRDLRHAGLVEWIDGQHGTIRPLVGIVEISCQGGSLSTGHGAPDGAGTPGARPVDGVATKKARA